MANFFGALAYAREGAFFKKEQEADLQRYIERLKEKGIILRDSGNRTPPRTVSFDNSVENFEVLGEILRQGARLNVPEAALLQEYEKRVKATLPSLTEEEFREWKRRVGPLGLASVSSIRLPTNKYFSLQQGMRSSYQKGLSPEVMEAARRQFMVALRGLVYGSVFGMMSVVSLGMFVCWYHNIQSVDDVKPLLQNWASPIGLSFKQTTTPFQIWARALTSKLKRNDAAEKNGLKYETEFSRALKRKFSTGR